MSSSAKPQRFHGHRLPSRSEVRYVPKLAVVGTVGGSVEQSANVDPPPQKLTSSLRGAGGCGGSASGGSHGGDSFVNYLLQDEAVASGLGADAGGLDVEESQRVVDLLNDRLSLLLKSSPRDFWREVAKNDSLHEFLDTYLQFRHRWYDLPHRGSKGTLAGVAVGDAELCRRVFMVLYRMSSNKDPGDRSSNGLSMKDHTALLQEKKLLNLPKLLDICSIYAKENEDLTRSLVMNAITAQQGLLEDVNTVICHFLKIAHTMHERCCSSLEVLHSSGSSAHHGHDQLYKDFLEVIDFINDAVVALDAFSDAYIPATVYFSNSFETSYGNEELLCTLARLHDSLVPSLRHGFQVIHGATIDNGKHISNELFLDASLSLDLLVTRIIKFSWKLLSTCYLSEAVMEDSVSNSFIKMLPANVEDPAIRGDILVQTLKEICEKVPCDFQENYSSCSFLQNIEMRYKLLLKIMDLKTTGWIFFDEEQFKYLSQIAAPPVSSSLMKQPNGAITSQEKVHVDEDAIILESKISEIKDIFPDYDEGFLSACLDIYNHNTEEVIQRILEGTLHGDLLALLDKGSSSLDKTQPVQHSKNVKGKGILVEAESKKAYTSSLDKTQPVQHSKNAKGKGILVEAEPKNAYISTKIDNEAGGSNTKNPSLPSSVSSYGRYTRKSNDDRPDSEILDSKSAKAEVRSAVLSAGNEYEDEYDDSFDDLGLSVAESGFDETENLDDKSVFLPEKSRGSENDTSRSSSRWNSQKKPQFYVKDGKNYSYKVSGSIAASTAQEASLINQAHSETIYGLGRGGNIPLGAVRKLMDANEQNQQISNATENSGRGCSASRGRGGRRGGANHHRKDRSMKKHFQGMGT